MKSLRLTLLLVLWASTAHAQGKPLSFALVTAQMTDAVTTTAAIASGRGHEANPLLAGLAGKPLPFALFKAGSAIGTDLLLMQVAHKHPTVAKVMGWSLVGWYSAVSIHNARIAGARR
jgi:hypothetical protein